jgi:hypothetical protein
MLIGASGCGAGNGVLGGPGCAGTGVLGGPVRTG